MVALDRSLSRADHREKANEEPRRKQRGIRRNRPANRSKLRGINPIAIKKGFLCSQLGSSFLLAHMPGEIGDRENADGAHAPRMLLDNHEPMNPPLLQHG